MTIFFRLFKSIVIFLREVRGEMKKVNWLGRKEVIRYTLIVFGVSFALALYLGVVDYVLTKILGIFILR